MKLSGTLNIKLYPILNAMGRSVLFFLYIALLQLTILSYAYGQSQNSYTVTNYTSEKPNYPIIEEEEVLPNDAETEQNIISDESVVNFAIVEKYFSRIQEI